MYEPSTRVLSKIFEGHPIYDDLWLVALAVVNNHASIIIEGLQKDGSSEQVLHYIAECDARLERSESLTSEKWLNKFGNLVALFSNVNGYLQPRFNEHIRTSDNRSYDQGIYTKKPSPPSDLEKLKLKYSNANTRRYYLEKDAAVKIIKKVVKQVKSYNKGIKQNFQIAGKYRLKLFGSNQGNNCITWAEDVLNKGGLTSQMMPLDYVKAVPKKHI